MDRQQLLKAAKKVLDHNDRGSYTVPAEKLYPHQWMWDSCFIAIGLRHTDPRRAQKELISLLRGQWANGMLPHILFSNDRSNWKQRHEEALINPHAPNGVITSGMTQPPIMAEAVLAVGEKLNAGDRRIWYKLMFQQIVAYHQWLYDERDPHKTGLVSAIHPYETGMDSSPVWLDQLHRYAWPWWLTLLDITRLIRLSKVLRRDTHFVRPEQRTRDSEALSSFLAIRRFRKLSFSGPEYLKSSWLPVEDIGFNSILARANTCLEQIANAIGEKLPAELAANARNTVNGLEQLRDQETGLYLSRRRMDKTPIGQITIASLLPLYSGAISSDHARKLVEYIRDDQWFGSHWPIPSVPVNSLNFNPWRYWQGPVWVNTNWMIWKGLKHYGYYQEAKMLRAKTLALAARGGMSEYFNPLNGRPAGAKNFSWTAALIIDLLND